MLVEAATGYIIHFVPYKGRWHGPVPNGDQQGSYKV